MSRIKILSESRAMIAPLTATAVDAESKQILDEAIAEVAGVDGDRVLDQFEAEAIKIAFEQLVPQAGQPITADLARDIKSALGMQVQAMKAERVQSTEVIFTSEGAALENFRGKLMGQMEDTIAKAKGKKVDINMMMFAFTDTVMADQIMEMAAANPNVTFRLLTDWSQLATSGGRQAPRLAKLVEKEGIENVVIKFKKDNPYIWDANANRPRFNHGSVKGLNHHKGFVALIDGRPEKMAMGSFNWSVTAMTKNYENVMLLDRADPDNRPIMKGYGKEFEAFWNNDDVALLYGEARKEKNRLYKELNEAHGVPYTARTIPDDTIADPVYEMLDESDAFDINSFSTGDAEELAAVVGKSLAGKIHKELRDYGRFDTWTELLVRVPGVAELDTWAREILMENLDFGDGGLSINTATVEELDLAGVSRGQAERIVAYRDEHGAFETLNELDNVSGIGPGTIARISDTMTDDENVGVYSATVPGEATTTGWAEEHQGTFAVPKTSDDGTVDGAVPANRVELEEIERDLAAPVIDMLRRTKPGETFRISMYGMSTSSPEFKALEGAIARGVHVRVAIYKSYNSGAIDKLKELRDDGFDVDLRVLSSRVMHEKFGVRGDDVFNGSSNWSSSSINKHTEDRFLFRNVPDIANRFVEEFARLWDKGKAV